MEDIKKKALNDEKLEQVTGGAGLGTSFGVHSLTNIEKEYKCRFCSKSSMKRGFYSSTKPNDRRKV